MRSNRVRPIAVVEAASDCDSEVALLALTKLQLKLVTSTAISLGHLVRFELTGQRVTQNFWAHIDGLEQWVDVSGDRHFESWSGDGAQGRGSDIRGLQ